MIRYLRKAREWFHRLGNSIGLLPSCLSLALGLLALGMMALEQSVLDQWLAQHFNWIQIETEETARAILGIIGGGIVSLAVFSFSMVMVVLNQASSTFSPRLLPGLVSQKSHQSVLGIYLGTLLYTLILMFHIRSPQNNYEIPSLGILGAVLLMAGCMGVFIYFIHSISRSVQIDAILEGIYTQTQQCLDQELNTLSELPVPSALLRYPVEAPTSGYLQDLQHAALLDFCQQHDLMVQMAHPQGTFLMQGEVLCHLNRDLSGETELREAFQNHFVFYAGEWVRENYLYGFKHLSEIAVKALSPGINDPATALSVLHHFGVIFCRYLQMPVNNPCVDRAGQIRLVLRHPELGDLLARTLGPIRFYGRQDAQILQRLLWLSARMWEACPRGDTARNQAILKLMQSVYHDMRREMNNPADQAWLNQHIERVNSSLPPEHALELL
ncbi:MAG: DUF2254 domain-containing protein [Candidatus Sericytochromatia bacterium]